MGAGDTPAGDFGAGFDPPAAPSPPREVSPPEALLLDGATRDVPLDALGRYAEAHPVDHRVALALFVTLGAVPAAPEIGSTLGAVLIDDPAPLQRDVEARVRAALQDELSAGNIDLIEVTATVPVRWRVGIRIVYRNLRLAGAPSRTLTA
jgi:hypothetical protein